jgi:hypothetical protein
LASFWILGEWRQGSSKTIPRYDLSFPVQVEDQIPKDYNAARVTFILGSGKRFKFEGSSQIGNAKR